MIFVSFSPTPITSCNEWPKHCKRCCLQLVCIASTSAFYSSPNSSHRLGLSTSSFIACFGETNCEGLFHIYSIITYDIIDVLCQNYHITSNVSLILSPVCDPVNLSQLHRTDSSLGVFFLFHGHVMGRYSHEAPRGPVSQYIYSDRH